MEVKDQELLSGGNMKAPRGVDHRGLPGVSQKPGVHPEGRKTPQASPHLSGRCAFANQNPRAGSWEVRGTCAQQLCGLRGMGDSLPDMFYRKKNEPHLNVGLEPADE